MFSIINLKTEYQDRPLGLDVKRPRFSWQFAGTDDGFLQTAYSITVKTAGGETVWETGRVESSVSTGIVYGGQALSACTRYTVFVTVWGNAFSEALDSDADENGSDAEKTDSDAEKTESDAEKTGSDAEKTGSDAADGSDAAGRTAEACACAETWFETGFLDPSVKAWEGAQWIGAPEKYVSARTIGVFVISSKFRLEKGSSRAGIVFGANDPRLTDARKNQYEIAGENYIRYVLDVSEIPARLEIWRVGYAPGDTAKKPFAVVPAAAYGKEPPEPVITEENRYDAHELKIEVIGDCAWTYLDGILIDAEERRGFHGFSTEARQLNPLGFNDVTTFPRLNEIGYYAGAGDTVYFDGLSVRNYRTPGAEIVHLDGCAFSGFAGRNPEAPPIPCERQETFDPSCHSLPMFRRDFKAEGSLVSARLYITARGIYDCRINGRAVTDSWFNPGCTQFDRHLRYQTYDVTPLIKEGENGIGITLASGWWCDAQTFVLRNYNYYGDRESVLARLTLEYSDGRRETLVTDTENWEYYGEGPYTYAGFFQGEHLDGRRIEEFEKFSEPGFVISDRSGRTASEAGTFSPKPSGCGEKIRRPVVIAPVPIESYSTMPAGFGRAWPAVNQGETEITGSFQAPVREVCRLSAKSVTEPRQGLFIYDLEQEIAGVPHIRLRGKAGTVVTIRYGEMLYPELPEYGNLHGLMLTENYRDAESIDLYTLRGDADGEIYEPRFTFHGFRYIEISGVEEAPALSDVQAIQLSSVPEITGSIRTSDPLVNRLIENVKWSQLCNFISIPTDCPQRNERMGWAGDTHVFCRTATYQSDARLFYYRYLEALRDLQEEDGRLPEIAPVGGGFGGITYEGAIIFMLWELYEQYGDLWVVREYYPAAKRFMDYIRRAGMPGPAFVGPIDDWLAPAGTDSSLIWNAFYVRYCLLMKRLSLVIANDAGTPAAEASAAAEDARRFAALEAEAKQYWNDTFVDPQTGRTRRADGTLNETQCSYALPLAYEVFEEKYREGAYRYLAETTRQVGCTISTGFFGTGLVCPMLTEGGNHDLAYSMLLQTKFPSWLYPVTQGATTIWERWNSYTVENGFGGNNSMNSFNHYSLGSVLSWIYETVLGIRRDEEHPGFARFTLQPDIRVLESAEGGIDTPFGRIESGWVRTGLRPQADSAESPQQGEECSGNSGGFTYTCLIPANTTAVLLLPGYEKMELGSGRYTFNGMV